MDVSTWRTMNEISLALGCANKSIERWSERGLFKPKVHRPGRCVLFDAVEVCNAIMCHTEIGARFRTNAKRYLVEVSAEIA